MENITNKMEKSVDNFKSNLGSLRTSRASPDMLSKITVNYYGAQVPLQQVASISVPENRVLMLNIFDANAIKDVERAILNSSLGLNPHVDGNIIRIRLPELTEERRKDLVKVVGQYSEDAKIAIRNIRRDEIDAIKTQEKNKELTEDDSKKMQQKIQKITDEKVTVIDNISQEKEKEILTI